MLGALRMSIDMMTSHESQSKCPCFDGTYNPQCFSDFLADMNHILYWYGIFNVQRVQFDKIKL